MYTLLFFVLAVLAHLYIDRQVSDSITQYILYSLVGLLLYFTYKAHVAYSIFS